MTTPGSSPVSADSVEANCCWPEVSVELADAGSVAPLDTPVVPSSPVPPVVSNDACVPDPIALASSLAKSLEDAELVEDQPLAELALLIPSCESSSDPFCSCCICCSIALIRVRTSEIVLLIEGSNRSSADAAGA